MLDVETRKALLETVDALTDVITSLDSRRPSMVPASVIRDAIGSLDGIRAQVRYTIKRDTDALLPARHGNEDADIPAAATGLVV